MKNVLTLFSVLVFANIANIANAQIDLKVYLESNYYKMESVNVLDTFRITSKTQSYWLQPSIAVAFNTRKKNFHQLSFKGLTFQKTAEERNSSNNGFKQQILNIDLQYGYFFTFLKKSKKWNPFVSIESRFKINNSKVVNSQNHKSKILRLSGSINSSIGTQFMFNDRIGLELASTFTFVDFTGYRRSQRSQNAANSTIDYYGDITKRANNLILKNIPIKLGLIVRI
jgi:hypothetical protein